MCTFSWWLFVLIDWFVLTFPNDVSVSLTPAIRSDTEHEWARGSYVPIRLKGFALNGLELISSIFFFKVFAGFPCIGLSCPNISDNKLWIALYFGQFVSEKCTSVDIHFNICVWLKLWNGNCNGDGRYN